MMVLTFLKKKEDIDNLYGPNFFFFKTYPIVFNPHFLILSHISHPPWIGMGDFGTLPGYATRLLTSSIS
jgi:hypothetical protein